MQLRSDVKCLFAMRVLRKKLILSAGQREHVLREGRILMETHCPFIARCLGSSSCRTPVASDYIMRP